MDTVVLVLIALFLAALLVIWTVLFVIVWIQIRRLMLLVGAWRYARKFFKQIERIRRDFSK